MNKKRWNMTKAIWLSYDLGVRGDYSGLFAWLDNIGAKECGDSLAFFKYELEQKENLKTKLKKEIQENIDIGHRDRIYITYRVDMTIKGTFLFGQRKASPWEGYGNTEVEIDG